MDIAEGLQKILPSNRIKTRLIDLLTYASDAGFYHLVPKAVVQVISEDEIAALFRFSHQHQIPVVFRTGGTSLSGQSVTDGILVDLSKYWNGISLTEKGKYVRVQPGITGGLVNAHLKKHARKIGPDPSSISAAMMGGIISNNSSGMCCGVSMNAYHTCRHIRFLLPDGKTFSTENPGDYDRFRIECPALFGTLEELRQQIAVSPALHQFIREKYKTKNTVGYSLNAFIDHEHPLDIFSHLLVGAEGTLAFIADAVLETVPDPPFKATTLLYFPDIYAACRAIFPLVESGAAMVELMDRASLRAVQDFPGIDPFIASLNDDAAALLIEFQEERLDDLSTRVNNFLAIAERFQMLNPPVFTSDSTEREFLWKIRKGLFPAVGAVRAAGTSVILEDVAFPIPVLGDAIRDLHLLFAKYQYTNAIIFGHAKDGNLHFVVTQSFNTESEIDRYDRFIREMVELVVKRYRGTLKAEHGTGRNMAPFVETEWGSEAYAIMKKIKEAADPLSLLNPGVIINDDPQTHRKHLKQMPVVEAEVDTCIECGYCEPVCPSRDITTTPRRRIVARRALALLNAGGKSEDYKNVLHDYQYEGLDTCAVDGLCAEACPVDINTGDLVKRLRNENHSRMENQLSLFAAKNFGVLVPVIRFLLKGGFFLNRVLGRKFMYRLTHTFRKVVSGFPLWTNEIRYPPPLNLRSSVGSSMSADPEEEIIYFPACISRIFGSSPEGKKDQLSLFLSITGKSGLKVTVPEGINGWCCSQAFGSKGYYPAADYVANRIVEQLYAATRQGQLPVVIDVSSCAQTLRGLVKRLDEQNATLFSKLKIYDSAEFMLQYVLPRVNLKRLEKTIVLHPVCSLKKMHTEHLFVQLAKACATDVTVPMHSGCCGMAGDRGFLFPELTASATAPEAKEVCTKNFDGYYSSTITCEMAMSAAVGKNYESILYLVDKAIQ